MGKLKTHVIIWIASALVIGAAAIATRYAREIAAARGEIQRLGSLVAETACGPIEYAREGDGYPLLVVHGAMGGFDAGLSIARPFIDQGFQVISVSRFGYLRSPLPADATLNRQADAYACLLDTLGIRHAAVIGVSGGATSSIRFAARHPERITALVLISPAAPGKIKVEPPPRALFDRFLRSDFVYWSFITYLRPMMQRVIGVPKDLTLTAEMTSDANKVLAETLPVSGRMDGFIYDNFGMTDEFFEVISETSPYPLETIQTSVLVINALDDPLAVPENVRGLAEKLGNARLLVLPDGGHLLLGHGDEVQTEITQFLQRYALELNQTSGK